MSNDAPTARDDASPSFLRRHRLLFMVGVPLIVIGIGVWLWATGGRYAATDDAFVQTGRVQISANISGHVVELAVRDNQRVRKGQLLFRLEGATPRAAAEQAAAAVASAQAQVQAYGATYKQRQAEVAAAKNTVAYRRQELARDRNLSAQGVVSKEDTDEAQHALDQAVNALASAEQALAVAAANLGVSAPAADNPAVLQARANLERARLTEADTIVRAPQDGVVTRVSQLQVGSYVQAAQPVFSLVTDELWVDANFKEGDLAHMKPGQKATVKVDAYPDLDLTAQVDSISPGTGSSFSLLPPENATGNWVKVVQRVPVRLHFTRRPEHALQGGLSAVVKVDTEFRRLGAKAAAQ